MKRLIFITSFFLLVLPAWATEPTVIDTSIAVTASVANYWPSSTGVTVADYEYFGYQMIDLETTGSDPGATVTLEVSNDGTSWTAYTQPIFYPVTGVGAASIAITNETALQGSIHPAACMFFRLVVTETAADSDTVFTCHLFLQ